MLVYRVIYLKNEISSVALAFTDVTLKKNEETYFYALDAFIYYALVRAPNIERATVKGQQVLENFLATKNNNFKIA